MKIADAQLARERRRGQCAAKRHYQKEQRYKKGRTSKICTNSALGGTPANRLRVTGFHVTGFHGEAAQEGVTPKLTRGTSRSAAAVISKNSRVLNPVMPATMLEGNCSTRVFRSRTTAL